MRPPGVVEVAVAVAALPFQLAAQRRLAGFLFHGAGVPAGLPLGGEEKVKHGGGHAAAMQFHRARGIQCEVHAVIADALFQEGGIRMVLRQPYQVVGGQGARCGA